MGKFFYVMKVVYLCDVARVSLCEVLLLCD